MRFSTLQMQMFSSLCIAMFVNTSLAISMSKQGCDDKCGDIIIPYPFGTGSECSANSSFTIICNSSTPFLSSINLQVLNITVEGVVIVAQPVKPMSCSSEQTTETLHVSPAGTPFTISARYNSLVVLGCSNSVWLLANDTTRVAGCLAICDANNSTDYNNCRGLNCCKAPIPPRLQRFQYSYQNNHNSNGNFCGYALLVDKKWFQEDYKWYRGLHSNQSYPYDPEFVSAPLVLEWELDNPMPNNPELEYFGRCSYAISYTYPSAYSDEYTDASTWLNYDRYSSDHDLVSSTKYCSCGGWSEGNPYLSGRCIDIDECAQNSTNKCPQGMICINTDGGYMCRYPEKDNSISKENIAFISIGSALGGVILLVVVWMSAKAIRKRIKARRRHQFFKRNGGLLLKQQLRGTDNSLEKAKLFTYKELARATDHYNENRIIGRGGQGTVYKGMLMDGRVLAVKKSKKVEEGDLQVFINEVIILSQLNHRNVVKLLGCCLETEVPLLVYEFIPNGTLLHHIHEPSEEFSLTWEMRVRIAREVACALAYLHSSASAPIYHRDIKSTNILLDDKYHAKISDFGTSRSIAIDQTHLTTRVIGTFGYFDPEYFQSSQFTDKSDVYSFGVVMVELLTGEKVVSANRVEEGIGLATHFLQFMERNQLFDILDARVLKESKREEIEVIAELARRCLHFNGKRRPTMMEVASTLEAVQTSKVGSSFVRNRNDRREWSALEVDDAVEVIDAESYDFTSMSDSMQFNTISPHSPSARPLIA